MKNRMDFVVYSRYKIDSGDFRILEIDKEFTRILGYSKKDIQERKLTQKDIIFEEEWDQYTELLSKTRGDRGAAYICHRLKKKNGEGLFVFCFGEDRYNEKEGRMEGTILITDVTSNEMLKEELFYKNLLLERVMENAAGGIAIFEFQNEKMSLQFVSRSFYEMFGAADWEMDYSVEGFLKYIGSRHSRQMFSDLKKAAEEQENIVKDYPVSVSGQEIRWIQSRFSGFQTGERFIVVTTFSDVTERKRKELDLLDKASRDSLTGIYNRTAYVERVEEYLSEERESMCALLMLDVDDFKRINDTVGHAGGDVFLQGMIRDIRKQLAVYDTGVLFGRMGGDEFSIFFPYVNNRETFRDTVRKSVEAGRNRLAEIKTSVSVGISLKRCGESSFQEMYYEADRALYFVKRQGKGSYAFFRKDILEERVSDERKAEESSGYIKDLGLVLDDVENIVCISDLDTYKLLYVNEAAKRAFEDEEAGICWQNMTSYEYLWGDEKSRIPYSPENLQLDRDFMWETVNEKNGRHYILRDRAIWWKGRTARLQVVIDVTEMPDLMTALSSRFEIEDILQKCISNILNYEDFKTNHKQILGFVGDFYEADSVVLVETDSRGACQNTYEWLRSGMDSFAKGVQDFCPGEEDAAFLKLQEEKSILVVEHVPKIRETFPSLYRRMRNMNAWSLYSLPLFKEDVLKGRLMVFNGRKHAGEMTVLSMFGLFLMNELERKEEWERQQYGLTHDILTGLYNRESYMRYVKNLGELKSVGIVCVDANGLKQINNDFGYSYGSRIICEISDILKDVFREYYVARFDGDDFNICCPNVDRQHFMDLVQEARKRFAAHVSGASIGYAWNDFEIDMKKMSAHAEEIMKIEKQRYYENLAEHSMYQQQEIINLVKGYLNDGDFQIHIQPKVDLKSGACCGAEVLIRLQQSGELKRPAEFVPFLEKTETIHYVDLYVLEEVCRLLEKWKRAGKKALPISLNFSRKTLLVSDLEERVEEILNRYDAPRELLEIEITETIGDLEYDMIVRIADTLRNKGLKLAMDDFGIKYSSVYILSLIKFETLKLDRSMVASLEENETSRKVAKHVISMCRELGIVCVAEGVETKAQAEILREMHCDAAQGFLFGKPDAVEVFEKEYM